MSAEWSEAKIDPRYFVKTVRSDYADWRSAWPREAGQNSLDAGATLIEVTVEPVEGSCRVTWRDNGCGMDLAVMCDVFMSLGATTKDGDSGVGGFGIAAAVLTMTHEEYKLVSTGGAIEGSYSRYRPIPDRLDVGTSLTVLLTDVSAELMETKIRTWIASSSMPHVEVTLNGERVHCLGEVGETVAEIGDWGKIYASDGVGRLLVRIAGQFMYATYCPDTCGDKTVIVDVVDSSKFTSNRDRLKSTYANGLSEFIEKLYRDPTAIIELERGEGTVYPGTEGTLYIGSGPEPGSGLDGLTIARAAKAMVATADNTIRGTKHIKLKDGGAIKHKGYSVAIQNRSSAPVPKEFIPGSLSKRGARLLARWIACVELVAKVTNSGLCYVFPGFVFSTACSALYERSAEGTMILLNPVGIDTRSKLDFYKLVESACHEVTHAACTWHDERFAVLFGQNMVKVMMNMAQFEKIRKAL